MTNSNSKAVRDAISDEAAEWFQTMRGEQVSESTRAQFAAWLTRSPQHTGEYLQMVALWEDLGKLDPRRKLDVEGLIAAARSDDNVESLYPEHPASRPRRRRLWPAAIAAALALAVGLLWFADETGEVHETYVTSLGEQRSFSLEDGSLVHLNTRSKIRVHLTAGERRIELVHGEAMFQVAHDAGWPFVVEDENVVAHALGTRFNVYRREYGTQVTVIEGRVAVTARPAAAAGAAAIRVVPRVELSPGQQAEGLAGAGELKTSRVDLDRVTAWTTRRLMFEFETLDNVVAEFNRYNQTELRLADPALAELEVTAIFNADDPRSLVDSLAHIAGVDASEQPDGSLLLTVPAGDRTD